MISEKQFSDKPEFDGEWVPISQVYDLQMGKTPSRDVPEYWNNGDHNWVSIKDLGSYGKYVGKTSETISERGRKESGIKAVPADTLLMSFKLSLGKASITAEETFTNEAIMAFLDKGAYEVDIDYMWYQLRSKDWSAGTNTAVMGKTLNKKTLGSTLIRVPPIAKQREVARRLDSAENVLSLLGREKNTLDDLVKSQFVEMFGDPRLNTKEWPLVKLGDVASTRLGKMLDAKKQTGLEARPYLANTDVQWFRFNLENLKTMDFDVGDRKEFALRDGDVLATEGGEVGRCAIWHCELEECYFQKAVHRIRCDSERLLPIFLAWTFKMKSERNLFGSYVSRSTIAHLTGEKLRKVPIQLPPLALQQQFADFVAKVDKLGFDKACREP